MRVLLLTFTLMFVSAKYFDSDVQYMDWCGGSNLNPLQTAKAARMISGAFIACKDVIIDLNIRPSILKDFDRFCAILRLCSPIVLEATNGSRDPELLKTAGLNCLHKFLIGFDILYPNILKEYNIDLKKAFKELEVQCTVACTKRCTSLPC